MKGFSSNMYSVENRESLKKDLFDNCVKKEDKVVRGNRASDAPLSFLLSLVFRNKYEVMTEHGLSEVQ